MATAETFGDLNTDGHQITTESVVASLSPELRAGYWRMLEEAMMKRYDAGMNQGERQWDVEPPQPGP